LSSIDHLIAATAELYGADLLTRNVKHFPSYPDLKPVIYVPAGRIFEEVAIETTIRD